MLALQAEMRQQQKSADSLREEIVHLRSQVEQLQAHVHSHLTDTATAVGVALQQATGDVAEAIRNRRRDVGESGLLLNTALERTMQTHVDLLLRLQADRERITHIWAEHTSMHTRIPPRIRQKLAAAEKDDLMTLLDTLSFEDNVMRHLRYTYPPGSDHPEFSV